MGRFADYTLPGSFLLDAINVCLAIMQCPATIALSCYLIVIEQMRCLSLNMLRDLFDMSTHCLFSIARLIVDFQIKDA